MPIKTNMEATEKIRDAVKRFSDRKKLAELAGCTYQKIYDFEKGNEGVGYDIARKICAALGLDANTGEPRTIRAIVNKKTRHKTTKESLVIFNQETPFVIPDELEISEIEARAIIAARKSKLGADNIWALAVALGHSPTGGEAVAAVLAEEYGRAIELIGRLMQNKIKTDKAR